MRDQYDLVVLGGGIMGLACAFEEVLRGKRVAILDPNPLGRKASWAAAGILVARAGLVGSTPLREFYLRSLFGYPEWLSKVEAESGLNIPFDRHGDYQIFPLNNVASIRALQARERQLKRDKAFRFTVSEELPPFLHGHSIREKVRVFHFPDEAHLNNRILLEALETAVRSKGGEIFSGVVPTSLSLTGGQSTLAGESWRIQSRQILITAGAWCNDVLKLLNLSLPLSPVKGQLALVPNFYSQKCMVHCMEKLYLIPRGDFLIAGATTESGVWEEGFDSIGDSHLRIQLETFFPDMKPQWVETWSGLRPRISDRLPVMGWVDETNQIAICTGHYKSGISMAPLAARCMSALLNGEKTTAKLKPFDPWRDGGLRKA